MYNFKRGALVNVLSTRRSGSFARIGQQLRVVEPRATHRGEPYYILKEPIDIRGYPTKYYIFEDELELVDNA